MVAAASRCADGPLLVLDPTALPSAASLRAALDGRATPDALLVQRGPVLAHPVLTAARALASFVALLEALAPTAATAPPVVVRALPALPGPGTGRTDLLSLVVVVSGTPEQTRAALAAARRGGRRRLEVLAVDGGAPAATRRWLGAQRDLRVVATGRGVVADVGAALAAGSGAHVVLLDDRVTLPRFWADGVLRALGVDGVVAAGPRAAFLPGEQGVPAGSDPASPGPGRAGAGTPTGRLDASCLALTRSSLGRTGLLDEGFAALSAAVTDLVVRLSQVGTLLVADDVLVQAPGRSPVQALAADDVRRLQAVHGPALGHDVWLSAALIVKDEQSALPTCLAALRGVVDEVVVCDTGSSDRTVEIARAFGAHVLTTPWTGDFAAARNTALDACRGRWVLSVDADEQLRLAPGADLRRQLLTLDAHTDAATVVIRSRYEQDGGPSFEHAAARLFRRGGLRWVGAVHEHVSDERTSRPPTVLPTEGVVLDHDGYLTEVFAARDKGGRNLGIAERDHAEATAGAGTPRAWKTGYELARALSGERSNAARVEALLREALARMPPGLAHLRCDAAVRLTTALAHQGRLPEAEQAAREGLAVDGGDPGLLLVLAQVLAVQDRHAEALALVNGPLTTTGPVRDRGKVEVDLPLLRARLLVTLDRGEEAADLLLSLAADRLDALDWGLLHRALQGRTDGAATLAIQVARAPAQALAALDGLDGPQRALLFTALRALGVDPEPHLPEAVHARRLAEALHGHDPAAVRAAALALEDTDPAAALSLWERLPDAAPHRVARARCLLLLDRTDEAVGAVDGLDPAALDLSDLLVVVALATAAGDRDTARALLAGVGEVPDALRATVDELTDALRSTRMSRPTGGYPTG